MTSTNLLGKSIGTLRFRSIWSALIVLGCLIWAHGAQAASITLGSTNVASGVTVSVPLTVDMGSSPLGRYEIDISFNTNVVGFINFNSNTNFFTGPLVNSGTAGHLIVNADNTKSLTSPTGVVQVALIDFQAVGSPGGASTLAFTIATLFDTDGSQVNPTKNNGSFNILPLPAASFTGSPTNGFAPLDVTFSDTSTGTITNRFWNFGDSSTLNTSSTSVPHTYNAAGTYTVSLTAMGPGGNHTFTRTNYIVAASVPPAQLQVTPSSRNFGTLVVGQSSTQTFSAINIGGLSLTGTPTVAGPFSIASGSSYIVAPGQTGTVNVAFTPGSAGNFSNTVIFSSNGGGSSNAVTGVAITPAALGVNPSSINFGTVATGAVSQANFVVTNTGGASLTGTVSVVAGPFSILSGGSFTAAGFGSTNVVVRFQPTSVGGVSNNVIFASNGGGSSNLVQGTGAIAPSANFSGGPTNDLSPLTVLFTDISTGTISNRLWSFGDGSTLSTTNTNVGHTYYQAGSNDVRLIAQGPLGASTNTKPAYVIVRAYPPGDVNGDSAVKGDDALLMNQVIVGLRDTTSAVFQTTGYANGDVNRSGSVSGGDPLLINQVIVGLRAFLVTKVLPPSRPDTSPVPVTIYGVGFPTNASVSVTIGSPVNLTLSNVVVVSRERIDAIVPSGGGSGTGTVSVITASTNGVLSFGQFVNP